jgi:tRNA A-37 threonylcarbamoyl transferase component Bud32
MGRADYRHLAYESKVYNHLRSLQGKYIPVSLGMVDLRLPYYYNGETYTSMLFLCWVGRLLNQYLTPKYGPRILDQVNYALESVHRQQVLHTDVKSHNWLWEEQLGKLMLIDFERAEIRARSPLGILSPNRKRNLRGPPGRALFLKP